MTSQCEFISIIFFFFFYNIMSKIFMFDYSINIPNKIIQYVLVAYSKNIVKYNNFKNENQFTITFIVK